MSVEKWQSQSSFRAVRYVWYTIVSIVNSLIEPLCLVTKNFRYLSYWKLFIVLEIRSQIFSETKLILDLKKLRALLFIQILNLHLS